MTTITTSPFIYHEVRQITIDDYIPLTTDDNIMIEDDPKPSFYLPSNIMANIMSYLPTPLDHHKKKMKIVNEDFEIIRDRGEYCDHFERWSLRPRTYGRYDFPLMYHWSNWINHERRSLEREKELIIIKPKLDRRIEEWKTKQNIIKNIEALGIEIDSYTKREKKEVMIHGIKKSLFNSFINPHIGDNVLETEDFLYSL